MQLDQDRLKKENNDLIAAFREKHRKHQQTQELYDRLKRKEMTAVTQSAAMESVDEALGNVISRPGLGASLHSQQHPHERAMPGYRGHSSNYVEHKGGHRLDAHYRSSSNHSQGSAGGMPPPPIRRPGDLHGTFGNCEFLDRESIFLDSNNVQPPILCQRPQIIAHSLVQYHSQSTD